MGSSDTIKCEVCGGPKIREDRLEGLLYCEKCEKILAVLPQGRTYMLLGESGAGKSIFLYKVIDIYLKNQKPCIYTLFDEHPAQARGTMKSFIRRLDSYEGSDLLSFVDCHSCIGGIKSEEKYFIPTPGDLNELNLVLLNLINKLGPDQPAKVFLDSATAMFIHCETGSVLKFLSSLSAKLRPRNGSLFFTLVKGAVSPEVEKKLEQIADGLVEFKLSETEARVRRYYRFSKVRGTMYFDTWLPFFIGKDTIFLGPPEERELLDRFNNVFKLIAAEA